MPTVPSLDVAKLLRRTPQFRKLDDDLFAAVLGCTSVRKLGPGEILFSEGDIATGFFVVAAGRVRLARLTADGREQVMHELKPGQSFAEAALLTLGVFPVTASAVVTSRLVQVDGPCFLRLFQTDSRMGRAMVASLSIRLLDLVTRVEELSRASAGARLAHFVLRQPSTVEGSRARVELPMSKKDLAGYLSITPETLSRLLGRWRDRGLLEVERRVLWVLDEAGLSLIADGQASG